MPICVTDKSFAPAHEINFACLSALLLNDKVLELTNKEDLVLAKSFSPTLKKFNPLIKALVMLTVLPKGAFCVIWAFRAV